MKPLHKQRLVTRGCFLGGVVYMKPFHKQRLVTPWLFSWILKDICFSPGACKQRLGTRVLFSWGGVVYNKFLKIFVSPQGPANKDWEPVCCFLGGGLFTTNSYRYLFLPRGLQTKTGNPCVVLGGGGGGRTSPKQLENRKL